MYEKLWNKRWLTGLGNAFSDVLSDNSIDGLPFSCRAWKSEFKSLKEMRKSWEHRDEDQYLYTEVFKAWFSSLGLMRTLRKDWCTTEGYSRVKWRLSRTSPMMRHRGHWQKRQQNKGNDLLFVEEILFQKIQSNTDNKNGTQLTLSLIFSLKVRNALYYERKIHLYLKSWNKL